MNFQFDKETLSSFTGNIHREWSITNGIGGYGGSSIIGAHNRTHQGYLIASLHPPVERYLVFSKTNEKIISDEIYDLTTSQHAGEVIAQDTIIHQEDLPEAYRREDTVFVPADFELRKPIYTEGQKYLTSFSYDGTVTFTYKAGPVQLKKQISLVQGENTVAISYEFINQGNDAEAVITPLFNYRDHSGSSRPEDLKFTVKEQNGSLLLIPEANPDCEILLQYSEGDLISREELYDVDMQLQTEVDNETPGLDCHYTPYDIKISLPAGKTTRFSLICSVSTEENPVPERACTADLAFELIDAKKAYLEDLITQSGLKDELAQALVVASDQFLCHRSSTGLKTVLAGLPWFTDWGRDTMIAFTGLTLVTKRFKEAEEILITFAKYVKNGLVPNMFPDDGQDPLYNTADASLWYFYAVDQYLSYVNTPEAYDFIYQNIYPCLKEIIAAYKNGTDFSIYMEEDGLIHAGSGVDQITWMDVRVGDWVVTPRHGKPVEINALWYHALCVMDQLAAHYGEPTEEYSVLASKVKESFLEEFWNEKDGCLYDVVDGDNKDASIRPNQIYAVSLPNTMLDEEKAKKVVSVVKDKLFAESGLRSLAPEDEQYHPIYCGSLPKRDAAYHQGTSWGYLLGGFYSAFMKVNNYSAEAAKEADTMLNGTRKHLYEGGIGSISEIFDGEAPHTCRGCYAQAWSVGEILRCYTQDILPYLK
ncbi:MAG: glycogen debranching enzyme family protein [Agathobacter sp.]|nr:glycogen debranching enzyme family protein [Agathobacter sp.]